MSDEVYTVENLIEDVRKLRQEYIEAALTLASASTNSRHTEPGWLAITSDELVVRASHVGRTLLPGSPRDGWADYSKG